MEKKKFGDQLWISGQLSLTQVEEAAAAGFKSILVNRPDGESKDQPSFSEIRDKARSFGIDVVYQPISPNNISEDDVRTFGKLLSDLPGPVLAYCRTGTRTATLWALQQSQNKPLAEILATGKAAGIDLSGAAARIAAAEKLATDQSSESHKIVIIGGGAAGIAVAASLLSRVKDLDIAIVDPSDVHYYQPGWTMVGAGIFEPQETRRDIRSLVPSGAKLIKAAVAAFSPDGNMVILDNGKILKYEWMVVAPGLKLDWGAIEGLTETLGKNGVTSNYQYDLASYTWQLVQHFKGGAALFTQPPMPIKCAGAPQKAMYLSCDHWMKKRVLGNSSVEFLNAGPVLFGVADYVPPLMEYVKRYDIELSFGHSLFKIDGPAKIAWFKKTNKDGSSEVVERRFDMIHVVPPQTAPDFIRTSTLAAESGWVSVDQGTLKHTKYDNIYSLGDVMSAPNAKTAAAARKQAPIVAENLLADMGKYGRDKRAIYDGYGSCPLTVERGKIILAEFGYGGKRTPTFPAWFINDLKPSRLSWLLKQRVLPPIYWHAMLKGRELLAKPTRKGGKI